MAKKKTFKKQKTSSRKPNSRIDLSKFEERKPLEFLLDKNNIVNAVIECLDSNDIDGIVEVLQMHFWALQKLQNQKASSRVPG